MTDSSAVPLFFDLILLPGMFFFLKRIGKAYGISTAAITIILNL